MKAIPLLNTTDLKVGIKQLIKKKHINVLKDNDHHKRKDIQDKIYANTSLHSMARQTRNSNEANTKLPIDQDKYKVIELNIYKDLARMK